MIVMDRIDDSRHSRHLCLGAYARLTRVRTRANDYTRTYMGRERERIGNSSLLFGRQPVCFLRHKRAASLPARPPALFVPSAISFLSIRPLRVEANRAESESRRVKSAGEIGRDDSRGRAVVSVVPENACPLVDSRDY